MTTENVEVSNHTTEEDSIPFYPDHVITEFKVVLGIVALVFLVGILGLFKPVGVGDPADPLNTPLHVKPEWYFLSLYQLLRFIPKTAGVILPIALVFIVFIWPFLDRKANSSRTQLVRLIVTIVGLIILIALTIWGEVS